MLSAQRWRTAGEGVGRSMAKVVAPILWGVLVGGTGLPVMPDGPFVRTSLLLAVTLMLMSPPRGRRLVDLPLRDRIVRLALMTGLVLTASDVVVEPSAYLVGCVCFLASKAMSGGPWGWGAAAMAVLALAGGGAVQDPAVSLLSGEPWTFGVAARDVIRFALLAALVAMARDDQRVAARLEQSRQEAVREERTRIARELHDVVAHHVSVMTIQAEAGRSHLPAGAERADAAIAAAAESGRTAMTELRRLLGVLRSDDGERGGLGPQPGLGDLGTLVAEVRAAGIPVEVTVRGDDTPLAEGVSLSAYRIIQEAVTNAMKHAPGEPIRILVDQGPSALTVEVANAGGRPVTATAARSGVGGHGIIGMRERALLHGGALRAGPGPDGRGWVVRADLLLDPAAA